MHPYSSNIRIAKNTIYLYFRLIIILFVSFFSSRLVLEILGETDLGIYNIVGGVVLLLSFLNSALTKATQRFITFELGRNSQSEKLKKVFSISLTIHLGIAIIACIFGETIGLWLVNNYIVLPNERIFAANWVYQLAIITFCFHVIRVPYDAVIIANENMSVYAYISIFEALLQLGLIFLIKNIIGDKLIIYSIIIAFIACSLLLIYHLYVRWKYPAYSFSLIIDKEYYKKILKFSSWTLLGSAANVSTQQGVNLLLNRFVGLVANTALGFANQVNQFVSRFVSSFSTAFNPQIIKDFAQGDYKSMHLLMGRASKFSFFLAYLLALPLIVNMEFLLQLWLVRVPEYTTGFCQMILICSVIDATTGVYNSAITATGEIKNYQLCITISFLIDLLLAYLLLSNKMHPMLVFGSRILTRGFFNMCIGLFFIKKQLDFDLLNYFRKVLTPIIFTLILTILPTLYLYNNYKNIQLFFLTFIIVGFLLAISLYFFILDKVEKNKLKIFILRRNDKI